MTTPAGASTGNGYWRGQIGATALFGVGMVACSVVLFRVDPDEPGRAVLLAFGGLLFLTTLGWAVDAATRSDPRQRALFAWAVAQREAARLRGTATTPSRWPMRRVPGTVRSMPNGFGRCRRSALTTRTRAAHSATTRTAGPPRPPGRTGSGSPCSRCSLR